MAISPPETRTPTTIQSLSVTLSDWLADEFQEADQSATYQLVVLDQNGAKMSWPHDTGNLAPHITVEERDWLMAFMSSLRERAETAVLGE